MVKRSDGFTLIELMIVVAVVGVMAAIAYPSYLEFVREARRTDAMSTLLTAQLEQEKFRANNITYASTAASLGVSTTSPDSFYSIAVASSAANSFIVTATPAGNQIGDGCGTFAVDQGGANHTAGYADADCWNR
ncbi:type IV pilin protein [Amphritea balenae]|nr:type IV pilin protein [Amphritea balenae]GGK83503.1 type IV pilin [Amphritea balenae]